MNKRTTWLGFSKKILVGLVALGGVSFNPYSATISSSKEFEGKAIYQRNCSVCHGDTGNANSRAAGSLNPKPKDFTNPQIAAELTRERMIHSVTNGRPGTAMVGHARKLTAPQIEAVVDYIRGNFMSSSPSSRPVQVSKTSDKGRQIYKRNCSACHGDQGNTAVWARSSLNPAPRDFTSPIAISELTRDRMIDSVTKGRSGTAMMPFQTRLSKKEIEEVVDYIRTTFMHLEPSLPMQRALNTEVPSASMKPIDPPLGLDVPGLPGGAPPGGVKAIKTDMSLSFPNKLKGNVTRGGEFFGRNCFVCHGMKGDGNGPRAYFIAPRPRNFTSEQSRNTFNRPKLYESISLGKPGTVMPAWNKVLTDQQISDVAEYVFQAFILGKLKINAGAANAMAEMEKKKTH